MLAHPGWLTGLIMVVTIVCAMIIYVLANRISYNASSVYTARCTLWKMYSAMQYQPIPMKNGLVAWRAPIENTISNMTPGSRHIALEAVAVVRDLLSRP